MTAARRDDESILDEDGLLRRVPHWPNMTKFCHQTGTLRPSSACFKDKGTGDTEVSVTLENDLLASGKTHNDATQMQGFGLAKLNAGFARTKLSNVQIINRSPEELDPHHALVIGDKTSRDLKKLAQAAELIIPPDIRD